MIYLLLLWFVLSLTLTSAVANAPGETKGAKHVLYVVLSLPGLLFNKALSFVGAHQSTGLLAKIGAWFKS